MEDSKHVVIPLFRIFDIAKAKEYLKAAESTGSKNPELLKRATAINSK